MSFYLFVNIQGLHPKTVPSKVPFINDLLYEKKQIFIGLSETWLQDHKDAEISIPNYKLFRVDSKRKKKSNRGRINGGVAIYLREDVAATFNPILQYTDGVIQILCIYSKAENLVIGVVYRQPDDKERNNRSTASQYKRAMNAFKETIIALAHPTPEILLGGDFNLPHINWPECSPTKKATKDEKDMIQLTYELGFELNLSQVINQPTHIAGNTLDLLFTNNPNLIHNYITTPTLRSFTDHYIMEISSSYNFISIPYKPDVTQKRSPMGRLNFHSEDVNWESLAEMLSKVNWKLELENMTSDLMFDRFYSICLDIAQKVVPNKSCFQIKKETKIPRERINLMRRRSRINKLLIRVTSISRKEKLQDELVTIEKALQKSYKDSISYRENKAFNAIKNNSKYFFKYAKRFSKIKTSIGPLLNEKNEFESDSKKMADMLLNQYSSVFSTPSSLNPQTACESSNIQHTTQLDDIIFDDSDFIEAINELSSNSASGPDDFPSILLKNCKKELARPLNLLWRKSLDDGQITSILTTSLVSPQHKGGSQATPANYRPIALTSHLIKVFEKILRNKIVSFMDQNHLFNNSQHGFRSGRSCLSQLLSHYDKILNILAEDSNVDVIYLDFAKAFDKVDFTIALKKMKNIGIDGKILRWISAFLHYRTQTVVVNGIHSSPAPVLSGVPQGSVLGPLIFLILMGDIDSRLNFSTLSSFADDTRVLSGIKSINDSVNLQKDLNSIYDWADINNMSFNNTKFEVLRYGKDIVTKDSTNYTSSTGLVISEKISTKDLGIIMHSDGSFNQHINQLVENGKQLSGWILRVFHSRSPTLMLTLWKSLVIPRLEYCSQLWSPSKVGNIQKIESLQWSFIRKIKGSKDMNYWQCLKHFKLYSLQRRRERYQIIYCWKLLEYLVPNLESDGIPIISVNNHIRKGRLCVTPKVLSHLPNSLQSLYYNTLRYQGPRLFNILPKYLRELTGCSVDKFKNILDEFLKNICDEPQIVGYTANRSADSNSIIHMLNVGTVFLPSLILGGRKDQAVSSSTFNKNKSPAVTRKT